MTQKELAIQCLEKLNIYKPYIRKFKSKETLPCFFENFGGFWVDQEPKLFSKIKEIESTYKVLVYGVTHEFTEIGETWSMLCISQGSGSIGDYITDAGGSKFYVYSYVWNKTYPHCSEFGDILVLSFGGGIKRIG